MIDLPSRISQPSHRLGGRHRTQMSVPDTCWTLTCGYGFCRTHRTRRADLRIRRFGGSNPSERATATAGQGLVLSREARP
jgi:hypothetical protein